MEWKPALQGTYGTIMNAFWWVVVEIWTFEKPEHKTLTQCDVAADDRGDYNSSHCTSYRWAKNLLFLVNTILKYLQIFNSYDESIQIFTHA